MIEATCTACGNINRVAEADIPVGAKFVNCGSCKARVAIPTKTTIGPPGPPGTNPPPIPEMQRRAQDQAKLQTKTELGIGLTDLPAPKHRSSVLGAEASKPAPRSGLAAALDADLPAPRGKPQPVLPDAAGDLLPHGVDLGGVSDLPAPKSPSARSALQDAGADLPAPKPRMAATADLPAPKARPVPPAIPPTPIPPAPPPALVDLPAPKAPVPALADLPAPKRAPTPVPVPKAAPGSVPGVPIDLPLPGVVDLPAPKGPGPLVDLPMPKAPPAVIADLPTPRGPSVPDLLTPKGPSGIADLPMPVVGAGDLLAPKGFFDDLPQPAQTKTSDLAPKGFFDDLPARKSESAAKANPELPAPKGFFDDLPGRVNPNKPQIAEPPAPKGFFDDLPGRVNATKPAIAEPPAPKGFFEDIPGRVNPNKPVPAQPPAPKGFFDDLPQPSKKSFDVPVQPARAKEPTPSPPVAPEFARPPLPLPAPELRADDSTENKFDDLDLSKPGPQQIPAQMRIDTPKRPGTTGTPRGSEGLPPIKGADVSLELEVPRPSPTTKLEPRRARTQAADTKPRPSRVRTIVSVVLLLAVLVGGGIFAYKKFFSKPAVSTDDVKVDVARAKAAIAGTDATHWDVAAAAARRVLDKDESNADALGIGAEATIASALATGVGGPSKLGLGRRYLATAAKESIGGTYIVRAKALSAIAAGTPDGAIEILKPLAAATPNDAALALYLGWAHAVRGDHAEAIKTFDQAATVGVDVLKLYAIYGRGQSRLAQADLAGAATDFNAVYTTDPNHIGAQVGLAAALPIAQSQQQEEDLRGVLNRKDLDAADPRAVVLGWVLWAEAARRGSRLDAARERYRRALALSPDDLRVLSGLAEVEMQDGKLDAATEMITKALALAKDDIRAQLVQTELSIRKGDLPDASARLEALSTRTPKPSTTEQARIKMMFGRFFDAYKDDEKAVVAYEEAAKLAGETDLVPVLAAVNKLTQLSEVAAKAKDTAKLADLRARADGLLATLAANAEKDPQLALTLGMAYVTAGDPVKGEPWLRKVVDLRPADAEGQYQLAKALMRLGKSDDAINRMQKAIALAPARLEIALELAVIYESLQRDADAATLYGQLLAGKDPGVEVRARAGRFYARTGEIGKAAEQGTKILAFDTSHPAGMYLKAEGLLADGKVEEARQLFGKAVDADPDPQYLDGKGRAAEAFSRKDGDSRAQDDAIRSYEAVIKIEPKMFNPHAGLGRLYVARHEAAKAVIPLGAAYGIRKDPQVAFQMGLAYKELQQFAVAIQWFVASIQLAPNAEASYHLGQLYLETNNPGALVAAFTEATRLGLAEEKKTGKTIPWMTDAYYQLGFTQKSLNNYGAARDAWLYYVGRSPPSGVKLDEVKRALATSLKGP